MILFFLRPPAVFGVLRHIPFLLHLRTILLPSYHKLISTGNSTCALFTTSGSLFRGILIRFQRYNSDSLSFWWSYVHVTVFCLRVKLMSAPSFSSQVTPEFFFSCFAMCPPSHDCFLSSYSAFLCGIHLYHVLAFLTRYPWA